MATLLQRLLFEVATAKLQKVEAPTAAIGIPRSISALKSGLPSLPHATISASMTADLQGRTRMLSRMKGSDA